MAMLLPIDDLAHVLMQTSPYWEELDGAHLFITGGTGFFGQWMVESLLYANDQLHLNCRATILTRDPERFLRQMPHLSGHPALSFITGDLCSFKVPATDRYTHILHMAADTGHRGQGDGQDSSVFNPLNTWDSLADGTRRVLELAKQNQARMLFTSSGAVYGTQPATVSHLDEQAPYAPDPTDPRSVYGEGKRVGELLCSLYGLKMQSSEQVPVVIARCFAFSGPLLPLNGPYALGNFLRDALAGNDIQVHGDGTPLRSYLYAADLAVWLWHLLLRGTPGTAYNVGSEISYSIADVAREVAQTVSPAINLRIAQSPSRVSQEAPSRYVPSTQRIRKELGVREHIALQDGIARTLNWYRKKWSSDESHGLYC